MTGESWIRLIAVGAAAVTVYVTLRFALIPIAHRISIHSKTVWDDILRDRKFRHRLALLGPVITLRLGLPLVEGLDAPIRAGSSVSWLSFLMRFVDALLIAFVFMTVWAMLVAVNRIYAQLPIAKDRPIKGYLQVITIALAIVAVVLVLARLADQPVGLFFSGLGALMAVLLLVFRDTLLSLVASIQIGQSDVVDIGDWIEIPTHEIDGEVVDIALHSVSVRNWDHTITTIPTHLLTADSLRNWRGMYEVGARRIKRSIAVDMTSVHFVTPDELEPMMARFPPEATYQPGGEVTNLDVYSEYALAYLRSRPDVAGHLTILVRQLAPAPTGIPVELYAFTNTTDWAEHERIQSHIINHLLALLPAFRLRVFQQPGGAVPETGLDITQPGVIQAAGAERGRPL